MVTGDSAKRAALAGIGWTLMAAACLAGLAVAVRLLGRTVHPVEIVFFRSLFGVMLLAPWLLTARLRLPTRGLWKLHAARAAIEFVALASWIGGIMFLPLGTAIAAAFTVPVFMVALGLFAFKERFSWRSLLGLAGGLIGVAVLTQPERAPFVPGIALMLTAALAIASSRALIKGLTRRANTAEIVFYLCVFQLPIAALGSIPVWRTPTGQELLLLGLVAVLATLAQVGMALSYRSAAFSLVAPFDYSQLLFAILLGWRVFGEIPSAETLVGAAIIVAAALASRSGARS